MSSRLSVEEILVNLKQRETLHREKEALHAQQEILHRRASDVLRRMLAEGEIQIAREGKAFHEALYVRRPKRG